MKTAVLALGTLAGALAFAQMPQRGVCAHRGNDGTMPENTTLAWANAVKLGAEMVEMDVHRCKTGELVIMHDRTVDRTTNGKGRVSELTFAEIRALDASCRKGRPTAGFSGVKVPTFDEAIESIPKDAKVWINCHCADDTAVEVAQAIKAKGRLGQAFIAASLGAIAKAREAVPEILACNMSRPYRGIDAYRKPWPPELSTQYALETVTNNCQFIQLLAPCSPGDVRLMHDAGVKISYFHCEDPKKVRALAELGIDFILTDNLRAIRAEFRDCVAGVGCATAGTDEAVRWRPRPSGGRVRVVQWGMCHEHADGKFQSLKKLPDVFELVGIVDDRASTTPRATKSYKQYDGIRRLTPEEVWADKSIECVLVEVTNDDLPPVALQCAEHGLAMHMDKPAGRDFALYERIVNLCRQRSIPLQMGYMFRVNPAIRFAQKAVREGWLGEIISVEADMNHSYGDSQYPPYVASLKGGLMYNLGCHLVDFILPMMNGKPKRAHVIRQAAPGDPEGCGTSCVSVLEWPRGTVTLRSARNAKMNVRWLRVQGSRGELDLRPIERFDGQPLKLELRLSEPAGGYAKGVHVVDFGVQEDRYADQLRELADIIRGRAPNPDLYDHDLAVHAVTLMASGLD